MDMQPIDPNKPLAATLTAAQWEAILRHLDAGQHRVVRPIIDALMGQLNQPPQMSPEIMEDFTAPPG